MKNLILTLAVLASPFCVSPSPVAACESSECRCAGQGEGSWISLHGRYSHDPMTGARVAQYTPLPKVRALPNVQNVSSGYRRSRVNFRGPYGSLDTITRVESFGNGRGGIDAEWERVNDVWQRSVLSAGSSYGGYGYSPYYGRGYGGRPFYGGGPGFGAGPGFGGGGGIAPPPPIR